MTREFVQLVSNSTLTLKLTLTAQEQSIPDSRALVRITSGNSHWKFTLIK
jgi:hypothetical protein